MFVERKVALHIEERVFCVEVVLPCSLDLVGLSLLLSLLQEHLHTENFLNVLFDFWG